MKKIIKNILMISTILYFITVTFSSSVNAENSLLLVENNNVSLNSKINLTLNLENIGYNKSNIKIYSSKTLTDVQLNNDPSELNVNNDQLEFTYDKSESDIKNITISMSVPENSEINDKITYRVVIIDVDNENNSVEEYQEITIVNDTATNENTNTDSNTKQNNSKVNNNIVISTSNIKTNNSFSSKTNQVTYNGSSNNYLKKLSVNKYSFTSKFKKENSTYFVNVGNNVNKISVTAKAESSNAKVNVSGNKDLKTGVNKVLITVTAEDGSIKYYRIYVIKK